MSAVEVASPVAVSESAIAFTLLVVGVSTATRYGNISSITLGLGYGSGVLALSSSLPWNANVIAPLGRMALTNYLVQSIVFGFVFYGYGLGGFGRTSMALGSAIGIAVYVAQGFVSHLWLLTFRFGPAEWLWRSFTYGAWQPMRK